MFIELRADGSVVHSGFRATYRCAEGAGTETDTDGDGLETDTDTDTDTETDAGTDTDAACDSDVWYMMSFLALAFALANFVIWCAEGFRVRCTVCRPLYLPAHSRERPLRR